MGRGSQGAPVRLIHFATLVALSFLSAVALVTTALHLALSWLAAVLVAG